MAAIPVLEARIVPSLIGDGNTTVGFERTWLAGLRRRPARFCVVEINEDAVVLPNGLVVTRTHRFDLGIEWDNREPGTSCAQAHVNLGTVFSFRFQYGYKYNPKHAAAQMAPLLCMAFDRLMAENASALSSGCDLFDRVARRKLAAARLIVARKQPVLAKRLRLIVRHPDDYGLPANSQGEHRLSRTDVAVPAGICARFAPARQVADSDPSRPRRLKMLYLPRSAAPGSTKKLSHTGRNFDNEHVLLESARKLAAQLGFGFDTTVFTSLDQQEAAFRDADIIAGPQGSAQSGLVFAKANVIMLEFVVARYDTVAIMNAFHPSGAYLVLHPHWYYGANAKRADTCAGTCTGWHLTAGDLSAFQSVVRCLAGDARCRQNVTSMAASSLHTTGSERRAAFPEQHLADLLDASAHAPNTTRPTNNKPPICNSIIHALPPLSWSTVIGLPPSSKWWNKPGAAHAFRTAYAQQYFKDARVCGNRSDLRDALRRGGFRVARLS